MQDKKYLYPILNFVEIQKPSYWNFNNLAVIVFSDENIFKEVSNNNFLIGDVSQNKYCKYYFNFSNISEFVETTTKKPSGLWENTFEVVNIFLLNYKIENKVVSNKLIFHGVKSCVYPDSKQLDLAVKDKLINIEHEWTFQEQREIPLLSKNKIYWFFENHFNSYQGDPNDFLNHSEELINNIWQAKNLPNLKRKKYFNEWLNEKKIELQELGFETVTNFITPHQTLSIEPSDQAEENKTDVKPQPLTFEKLFPSDADKDMVMNLLESLKIINANGEYLLEGKTGIIRVFIDVMKEEGCFVDIERKKILKVFTPKILGRLVEAIKEPDDFEVQKRKILKKYAELKK